MKLFIISRIHPGILKIVRTGLQSKKDEVEHWWLRLLQASRHGSKCFDHFVYPNILFCCCSVAKSCLTLCDPMDCSPPGSSVHGISQARILERVAIPFSRGSSQPRDPTHITLIVGRFFTAEPWGKPHPNRYRNTSTTSSMFSFQDMHIQLVY